jgi:hypothetical protein
MKLFNIVLLVTIAFNGTAQDKSKITPRDILAKCYNASANFDYDAVKECLSARNIAHVDAIKQKIESSDMKLQKGLIAAALQTSQYDIVEENVSANGKTATLKTKISVMGQILTADVVFVTENNTWKIDNVPNAKDIPNQVPILKQFIK